MYEDVGSGEFESGLLQHRGDSEHVIAPLPLSVHRNVEIEIKVAGKFRGANHELTIRSTTNTHVGREGNRCRHHKAVVVVGVLSDQIYAAGRTEYSRRLLED